MDTSNLDGAAKAYLNGGVEGVIDYYYAKNALNQMGMSNNEKNRQLVIDTLNEGGTEAVEKMISDGQQLAESFSDNMLFRYNHATNYIPTLDPQGFSDLFHAVDTEDPEKESIKQTELLAYLNQNNIDYDTAIQYWNAFGNNWSRIPYIDEKTGQYKV